MKKKLILNKETVTDLTRDEMHRVWGATLITFCTESCSLVKICCTPTTNKMMAEQDQG